MTKLTNSNLQLINEFVKGNRALGIPGMEKEFRELSITTNVGRLLVKSLFGTPVKYAVLINKYWRLEGLVEAMNRFTTELMDMDIDDVSELKEAQDLGKEILSLIQDINKTEIELDKVRRQVKRPRKPDADSMPPVLKSKKTLSASMWADLDDMQSLAAAITNKDYPSNTFFMEKDEITVSSQFTGDVDFVGMRLSRFLEAWRGLLLTIQQMNIPGVVFNDQEKYILEEETHYVILNFRAAMSRCEDLCSVMDNWIADND